MSSKRDLSISIAYLETDMDSVFELIDKLEKRVEKLEKKGKKIHETKK